MVLPVFYFVQRECFSAVFKAIQNFGASLMCLWMKFMRETCNQISFLRSYDNSYGNNDRDDESNRGKKATRKERMEEEGNIIIISRLY